MMGMATICKSRKSFQINFLNIANVDKRATTTLAMLFFSLFSYLDAG
jgi:hypothetical protein